MPPLSSCTNGPTTAQTSTTDKMFDAEVVRDDCDLVVEEETTSQTTGSSVSETKEPAPPMKIVWRNVILFAYLHLASVYGAYLMFTSSMWQTNAFGEFGETEFSDCPLGILFLDRDPLSHYFFKGIVQPKWMKNCVYLSNTEH